MKANILKEKTKYVTAKMSQTGQLPAAVLIPIVKNKICNQYQFDSDKNKLLGQLYHRIMDPSTKIFISFCFAVFP
jgi:hypothetical protein